MVSLETARQEWEAAHEAVQRLSATDRARAARVLVQVDLVSDELRRRVGQTFTLEDLARVYSDADRWAREVVHEHAATPGWPQDLALVEGAAFYQYQRGAVDYVP